MLTYPGLASIEDGKVKTNEDFDNLSSEIAKATPSGVKMSDYSPTNTAAASCPSVNSEWGAAATPLPPTANAQLCSCMMDTLSCTVADDVDEDDFGDLFGTVCGYSDGEYCAGINKNFTSGPYGAYGMCESKEQLAFALNAYAKANPNGGCDFKGSATSKAAAATTAASCGALMKQAGEDGTGTVTSSPSSTGGTAAGAAGSTGAAPGLSVPRFDGSLLGLSIYILGAAASGMAMVLL